MSSRLAGKSERQQAQQVRWPVLPLVAPVASPPPQIHEHRQALDEALAEAAQLRTQVESLQALAASAENNGYQRGLAEGRVQGAQDGIQQQKPVLDRMVRAIADVAMLRPKLRMQSEEGLIRLCVAIAHRVLKRELHMDPLALEGIVQAALSKVANEEIFRVKAHPRQVDSIRNELSRLGVPESVAVEGIASMDEGDLIVETASGSVDAGVNTQIVEVERGLTARFSV